jgi:effector-binding domain-containing protein
METPTASEPDHQPELAELPAATTAVIAAVVPADQLVALFDRSFSTLAAAVAGQGVAVEGPAFALYHGEPAETVDLEVGFVTGGTVQPDGEVRAGTLPGGRVARLVHRGGYDGLGSSWGRLRAWIEQQGLTPGRDLWEVYVTEPSPDMDPADLRTELNWPVEG